MWVEAVAWWNFFRVVYLPGLSDGGKISFVNSYGRPKYRKGTSIRQAPVFGTSEPRMEN